MSFGPHFRKFARVARDFRSLAIPTNVSIRRKYAGGDENLLAFERRIPALQSN
jgi:hypothetical protein